MLVDTSTPLWNIIFINDTWTRVTGNLFWGQNALHEASCFCLGSLRVEQACVKQCARVLAVEPSFE